LAVLFSDEYLTLKNQAATQKQKMAQRFFKILNKIPLEMKMHVVGKIYVSTRTLYRGNEVESALIRVLSVPFY